MRPIIVVSGFVMLTHALDSLCFGLQSLFNIGEAGRRTFCEELVKEQFFPLPLSPLYFSMFIRVTGACLLGYLGLMVGLSGFASHWCSLEKLAADSASSRISRHPTST